MQSRETKPMGNVPTPLAEDQLSGLRHIQNEVGNQAIDWLMRKLDELVARMGESLGETVSAGASGDL